MSGLATGIAQMPGFEASLRLLVEREQYSFEDIAMMFGVSRERIRQLCERFRVTKPGPAHQTGLHCVRVWDDAKNRFTPVGRGALQRQRVGKRIAQRRSAKLMRQARIIDIVATLKVSLGRDPSWREMYIAISGDHRDRGRANYAPYVLTYWGGHGGSSAKALRQFRSATGTRRRASSEWIQRKPNCTVCGTPKRVTASGFRYCANRRNHPSARSSETGE